MGGKVKQSNRTKNNVRPSSSGRSAELITSKVDPNLVLVGPGKLLPAVFPGLGGSSQERPLSNEFLLCFKKFHKKDPITKIKALNELRELVANSEQDDVVNALSSWAHYYPSLTVDMDRKVREATQACHGDIVRKCGRQVALQLKRLLPAWLLAQHDDYAPAQHTAQNDLLTTFPNEKLAEAIKFCKVEIMNLLLDNLKGNAGFLLSGKKIEDEEERQAVLARVTASSLRALRLVLSALPAAWLWDALQPLLCANTYWALAQHDSHHVRAAWYLVAGALAEQQPARLAAHGRRAARALLAHREAAPAHAAPQRWRALVAFMHHVEDWPSYMDNNDLLIKRLLDVLENAAFGEASKLSQLLIPVLTHLPPELITRDFYVTFFNAMFKGLYQKMLLSVKSERENWNNMIAVCIRYVSNHHQTEDYAVGIACWAHRTWLDKALTVPESQAKSHLVKSTATHMAGLVKYWLDQAKDGNLIFDQMIRNFWLNIGSTMLTQVEKLSTDRDDIVNLIEAHTLFVMTLKSAFVHGGKRKRSIKFQDEQDDTADVVPLQIECDEITFKRFHHNLVDAAEMLIGHYFEFANKHALVATVIPSLMTLFKDFHSREVLRMLAQKFEAEPIFNFYDRVLKEWLLDENLRCPGVVEVTFILLEYISEEEQNAVFDSFEKISPEVVEWCVALALAGAARGGGAARRWLRGPAVAAAARALAHRAAAAPPACCLLLAALAQYPDGEMMLSNEAIDGIIETSSELLNSLIAHDAEITLPDDAQRLRAERGKGQKEIKENKGQREIKEKARRKGEEDACSALEARVQLSAQLVRALPARCAARAVPLLLSLFRLTLHIPRGSARLALEAWLAAREAWRGAAAALAGAPRQAFVARALHYIQWHLFQDVENLNIQRIDHMVSLCPYFVIPTDDSPAPSDPADLVAHSRLVLNVEPKNQATQIPLDVFALQVDVIWGNIDCPFEDDNDLIAEVVKDKVVLTRETLMTHVYIKLFRALYVKAILLRKNESNEDSDVDEPSWCNDILKVKYFQEQFCNILYDCVLMDVLYDHYAFWRHYDIISEVKKRMDNILKDIIREISVECKETLTALLEEQAETHGYYWVYANQYYKDMTLEVQHNIDTAEKETQESESVAIELSKSKDDVEDSEATTKSDDDTVRSLGADADTDNEDQIESSESTPVSSSFEIIEKTDVVDSLPIPIDKESGTSDPAVEVQSAEEPVPLADVLKAYYNSCKQKKSSYLNKAAKPKANVVSKSEDVALYVDMLGEMVLKNGYFHEIQMKAALIRKRKQKAERQLKIINEYKLTEMELNAEHKVQDSTSFANDTQNEEIITNIIEYTDREEEILYKASDLAMIRSYYCVYAAQVPQVDEFITDVAKLSAEGNLDAVMNGYYRHNDTLLFERELREARWAQLASGAALARRLRAAAARGWCAPAARWDFVNIALCALLASLAATRKLWGTTQLAMLAQPTLELFCEVRRFVNNVPREAMRRRPAAHVAALPREWQDIFAPDANKNIYLIICHVLECSSNEVTVSQVAVIQSLMDATRYLDAAAMPAVLRTGLLTAERIVEVATAALVKTSHHAFKYLAYYTLKSVAPSLIEADLKVLATGGGSEDEDLLPTLSLQLYDEPFDTLQELVDAALSNYVVCLDICEVVPTSDSHSVALGYLLLAVAMHDHCKLATDDLALQYVTVFNTHPYAEGLVPAALRLLPAGAAAFAADAAPALPRALRPWFVRAQDFRLDEVCSSAVVSRLACGALTAALAGPGSAAARGWWAARRGRAPRAVQRLVRAAVAPALVQRQLADLAARAQLLGPKVKVVISAAERSATVSLEVEERVLALRVAFGAAHPLAAPLVHSPPPGPDPYWLALYLGYRNGRLLEASRMWLSAVGAALRDTAPCYVCYCRMHYADGSEPSVACNQCRNAFHAHCLRRWFRSANRSNCPVCRTNF